MSSPRCAAISSSRRHASGAVRRSWSYNVSSRLSSSRLAAASRWSLVQASATDARHALSNASVSAGAISRISMSLARGVSVRSAGRVASSIASSAFARLNERRRSSGASADRDRARSWLIASGGLGFFAWRAMMSGQNTSFAWVAYMDTRTRASARSVSDVRRDASRWANASRSFATAGRSSSAAHPAATMIAMLGATPDRFEKPPAMAANRRPARYAPAATGSPEKERANSNAMSALSSLSSTTSRTGSPITSSYRLPLATAVISKPELIQRFRGSPSPRCEAPAATASKSR